MNNTSAGFSLVELQIANWLGLVLLLMLLTTLTWVFHQYRLVKAVNEMQLNAILVNEILHKELRMAGFIGCPSIKDVAVEVESPNFRPSLANSVYGFAADSAMAKHYPLTQVKEHSDIILSWYSEPLSKPAASKAKREGWELISDCRRAKLRQPGDSESWPNKTAIAAFHYYAYYIRPCKSASKACYGLYRKPLLTSHSAAQELASGISDMRISYGISHAGHRLEFVRAEAVSDWTKVKIIKIELLLQSLQPVLSNPQRYWYHGKWHPAADRYLRFSQSTYINLRQR